MGAQLNLQWLNKNSSDFSILWPALDVGELCFGGLERIPRPTGYSLNHMASALMEVRSQEFTFEGFADGDERSLEAKAKSEAIERLVMSTYALNTGLADTSSGWSCHYSLDQAIENALYELIERDVALSAWENGSSFFLVPEILWPVKIREWALTYRTKLEYSLPRICLSEDKNGLVVSAFLFNSDGNCVVGHASKPNLNDSILAAFCECLRAGHSAVRFEYINEVTALHAGNRSLAHSPGAHSVAYAYTVRFPEHANFIQISESEVLSKWASHVKQQSERDLSKAEIIAFRVLDRVVVRIRDDSIRKIYWGLSENEIINKHPHIVG